MRWQYLKKSHPYAPALHGIHRKSTGENVGCRQYRRALPTHSIKSGAGSAPAAAQRHTAPYKLTRCRCCVRVRFPVTCAFLMTATLSSCATLCPSLLRPLPAVPKPTGRPPYRTRCGPRSSALHMQAAFPGPLFAVLAAAIASLNARPYAVRPRYLVPSGPGLAFPAPALPAAAPASLRAAVRPSVRRHSKTARKRDPLLPPPPDRRGSYTGRRPVPGSGGLVRPGAVSLSVPRGGRAGPNTRPHAPSHRF